MSPSKQELSLKSKQSDHSQSNIFTHLVYLLLLTCFIIALSVPVIYMLAQKRVHKYNMNLLYDVFENSTQHDQLYDKLAQSKYALVYGEKQGALFNFMDHFANKQTLMQRHVIVQEFHTSTAVWSYWLWQLKYKIQKILDLENKFKNIWILKSSTGQAIPKTAILKIMHRYPKDKIYIAITTNHKVHSFENFEYPSITKEEVKLSIKQNFKMDQNSVDILYDFYGSPQTALEALDIGHYTQQELMGQSYRDFISFNPQQIRILKELCNKGQVNVQNITGNLTEFGLVSHKGKTYWTDKYFMLNYELHKKIKCSDDGIATEEILFEIQSLQFPQMEKTSEELIEEDVWNEDEIVVIEQKPQQLQKPQKQQKPQKPQKTQKTKKKKSKKSKAPK